MQYIYYLLIILTLCNSYSLHPYCIILDPTGDAQHTGRSIGDSFERGITLQCVEKIKEYIEKHDAHYKIIITRTPGETISELQNASLSNRINADLFISLNFYYSQEAKPTLHLYQFSYDTNATQQLPSLCFVPYEQAYLLNKSHTDMIMNIFNKTLNQSQYNSLFHVSSHHALPVKQIIGITAPSFVIEVGIKHKDMSALFVEPIAQCIIQALR